MSSNTEEIWESQVRGRTFAEIRDADGRVRPISTKGVGSRMRLFTSDRARIQERIISPASDPFRNGALLRVDRSQQEDETTASENALSKEELADVFKLDMDDFRAYVPDLSEVNIRRLKEMASEVGATVLQAEFLTEYIEEHYRVTSGDTPTWREFNQGPSNARP